MTINNTYYILPFAMTPPNLFQPLRSEKKIFREISDQIRELIFSGVLKPGDKLPSEKEIAGQFSTGRMVVREALRILEQSGLVYIKQGSLGGAFVKTPDTTVMTRSISDLVKIGNVTLRELTETRLGIEKVILEFAISRITHDDLDLLKKSIEDSEKTFLDGKRATKDHINFHILLAKSTKNRLFEMIIESIMNVVFSYLQQVEPAKEHSIRVLNSHKKIYKAIQEKNLARAKKELEKHFLDVNSQLLSLLGSSKSSV